MKKCKLGDIAIIVSGQSPKSEYYTLNNLETPFLQGNRTFGDKYPYIDTYTKKVTKLAFKNSILMSVRAPVGDLNIVTVDCCIGRGICSINAKNGDNEFIYYLLKHNIKSILNQGNGTTYDAINKDQLGNLEIQLPSENEDYLKRISNLLSVLDGKIEKNNKINSELESMAKTIYDYWFLQFEFPNEEGKPYKSSGGKMVWNEELKREIPEGWGVGTLNYFINGDKGGDWGKDEVQGNYTKQVVCVRGTDFPALCGSDNLDAPIRFILQKNSEKVLEDGDLIIEVSGGSPTKSTGRICYINQNTLNRFDTDIITSNFCKAITLKNKEYQYWFYILWKTLYDNDVFFKYEGKTTGIKNLLFDMICNDYKNMIPDLKLVKKYNKKVTQIFDNIQLNHLENQQLASLRNFLLPLLMNGQVRFKEDISVKEIEVAMKEVAASVNGK